MAKSDNRAPVAKLTGPSEAIVGETVYFDGSGSSDAPPGIKAWTLTDSAGSEHAADKGHPPAQIPVIFTSGGTVDVVLTVTDAKRTQSTASVSVTVSEVDAPPMPVDAVWGWPDTWEQNDDFGPCTEANLEHGTETRRPVLVSPAEHGGDNTPPDPETRPAQRACVYVPPDIPWSEWQPAASGGQWTACQLDVSQPGGGKQSRVEYRTRGAEEERRVVWQACTYTPPPPPPPPADLPLPPDESDRLTDPVYFALASRPDVHTVYHQRSQAEIDRLPPRADNETKIPRTYDPEKRMALYMIDPSRSTPHSGSTGTPQTRVPILIRNERSSLLITWDMIVDESMRYLGTGWLDQHKSHRVDDGDQGPWLGIKQRYRGLTNHPGVCEYFFTAGAGFMGPGTGRGSSEKIGLWNLETGKIDTPPVYHIMPGQLTRTVIFIDGNFGFEDCAVKLSIWLIDKRGTVLHLDRVNMQTTAKGTDIFRFEYDSSLKSSLNGPGKMWNSNFVALKGLTYDAVVSEVLPLVALDTPAV